MAEVVPNLKPFGLCGCGCGIEGTLRVKAHRNGTICVRTGCKCKSCQGKRNKGQGQRSQTRVANMLNVPRANSLRPGHEENYGGTLRLEVKSGAQVRPILTAFAKAEKQSEAARPIGDNRPFIHAAVAGPKSGDLVYSFRARNQQQLIDVVLAFVDQLGLRE